MANRGLVIKPVEPEHFVFGDGKLGDSPINPSGQWDAFIPPATEQQDKGIEAMDCVTNAIRNAVYILIKEKYGDSILLSERFLAYVSGTTKEGNDPHTVAEALRTIGDVLESDYPYTPDLDTWDKFYTKPSPELYAEALAFIQDNNFGHSWVINEAQDGLMKALTYSPLTAGVYAWTKDPATGYYIRPPGARSEHDVVIYGYEKDKYWKVFDSYEDDLKKLDWDFTFDAVKRYTLDRKPVPVSVPQKDATTPVAAPQSPTEPLQEAVPSLWARIWEWVQRMLNIGEYSFHRTFGAERSAKWPQVRDAFVKQNPVCAVCGSKDGLNVHHMRPFHLDPSLELNPANLITLCRDHHFLFGHLMNWSSFNEDVDTDGKIWSGKIRTRPR